MKQTMSERIKQRRKELHLSQIALSKKAGCSQSTISYLENGSPDTKTINIVNLAKALETTPEWLEKGDTETSIQSVSNSKIESPRVNNVSFTISNGLIEIDPRDAIDIIKSLRLFVHYQSGISNDESIKTYIHQGTSMSPTVRPNDVVLVDIKINSFDTNGVYAISASGNLALKRIMVLSDGSYKVMSENQKEHPDMEILTLEKFKNVNIFGKALAFIHSQLL